MFKITAYCDDRRLADVLHALTGIIHANPTVEPVANAQVTNGKVTAVSSGNTPQQLGDFIRKNKMTEITPKQAKDWLKNNGRSIQSGSYVLKYLVDHGVLRKTGRGTGTRYTVK